MPKPPILPLRRDLQSRLEQTATLASIARRGGCSRFPLQREFQRAAGETPRQFVEPLRREQAAAAGVPPSRTAS